MPLAPYRISEAARRTARASGFDIDAPNRRYPVQNQKIESVLTQRGGQADPRARLLLRSRSVMSRILGRERSE